MPPGGRPATRYPGLLGRSIAASRGRDLASPRVVGRLPRSTVGHVPGPARSARPAGDGSRRARRPGCSGRSTATVRDVRAAGRTSRGCRRGRRPRPAAARRSRPGDGLVRRVGLAAAFLAAAFFAAAFLAVAFLPASSSTSWPPSWPASWRRASSEPGPRSRRSCSSSDGPLVGDGLDVVALAQRRVGLAVGDVGPEATVLHDHRLPATRVVAELAQRRLGAPAAAARLGWAKIASASSRVTVRSCSSVAEAAAVLVAALLHVRAVAAVVRR